MLNVPTFATAGRTPACVLGTLRPLQGPPVSLLGLCLRQMRCPPGEAGPLRCSDTPVFCPGGGISHLGSPGFWREEPLQGSAAVPDQRPLEAALAPCCSAARPQRLANPCCSQEVTRSKPVLPPLPGRVSGCPPPPHLAEPLASDSARFLAVWGLRC